jgi:hypothetical protein
MFLENTTQQQELRRELRAYFDSRKRVTNAAR